MRAAFATLVFVGLAAADPVPGGVSSAIAPKSSPPAGCSENYDGTFVIGPVNVTSSKRDLYGREIDERNTQLGITLKGGILTDPVGRTGYIAANEQFQFDDPPQAGAIWTAGFSVCQNGRLALGNDETWWKCLSGNFFNLYFKSQGDYCIESYLIARPINGAGGPVPPSVTPSTSASATGSSSSSASGSASSTMASSTVVGGNSTASASASASGSTTATTVVGGGHHTTTGGTGHTTAGGHHTTTTGGGGGSPTGGAASSSSSPGAAPLATLQAGFFGLAAAGFAMAVL